MTALSIIPKLFLACFRQLNCRTPIKIEFLPDKVKVTILEIFITMGQLKTSKMAFSHSGTQVWLSF